MENIFEIEKLICLLGLKRGDKQIKQFIKKTDLKAIITTDKDDDSNDEFVEFKTGGFGLHFMNDILVSIHFHASNDDSDYEEYRYTLPLGITFKRSKNDILEDLGKPTSQGGGNVGYFGTVPYWVKYKANSYYIHIEFFETDKINAVTIMNYE